MSKAQIIKILLILPVLFIGKVANAQSTPILNELHKVIASSVEEEDNFGGTIVLNDKYLFVSAKGDDDLYDYSTSDPNVLEPTYDNGAIYVYQKDSTNNIGWTLIQKILPPVDTANGGYPAFIFEMGKIITANDNYLILGTPQGGNNSSGVVYVLKHDTTTNQWAPIKELMPTTPKSGGFFGSSITLSSDFLAIKERPLLATHPTIVSIYQRNEGGADNWGKVKEVAHQNLSIEPFWAYDLSMTDDFLFIGSFQENSVSQGSGVVHIYGKNIGGTNNWGYWKAITSSDGHASQQFGYSVLAQDTTLIVGATRDNELGSSSGAVYIFYQNDGGMNNWGEAKKITASDIGSGDYFGNNFDLSGDSLLAISSVGHNQDKGAIYVFSKNRDSINTWNEIAKLEATANDSDDFFGETVAIQGSDVIVAAGYDDEIDINAGAFYTFDISTELVVNLPSSTNQSANHLVKEISLFPNPTDSGCFITFDALMQFNYPITVQIFDISGRLITEQSIYQNNQLISLNDMTTGIYFIKMIIDNQLFIGKLMKQ